MPGDLSAAEIFHLFLRSRHTIVKDDKGTHFLSIFLGRNSGYLHVFHAGEMIEELLQLTWIDILASTDNHILDTAGDTEVSILITNAQVAGMQEAILVDRFIGSGFVFIVTFHVIITAVTHLALYADGAFLASLRVDNPYLGKFELMAYSIITHLGRIFDTGVGHTR